MWKNPSLLLNSRAQYFRQQLPMLVNIFDNPYPKVSPRTLESALGHQYFERVFEDLRSLVHSNAPDFNNRFGSIFLRLAREIEDGRNYLLFSNLHSAMWDFFFRT